MLYICNDSYTKHVNCSELCMLHSMHVFHRLACVIPPLASNSSLPWSLSVLPCMYDRRKTSMVHSNVYTMVL